MTRGQIITTPPADLADLADLAGLVRLCHHRWTIPLVAVLGRDRGGRCAAIQRELGVARPTLVRALDAAGRLDLIMANPGYGHPLRPEYLLTPFGEAISAASLKLLLAAQSIDAGGTAWRKWSLPVLAALESSGPHFVGLQSALAPITPRALALCLEDLCASGWVERALPDVRPPRPRYTVAARATALAEAALELAVAAR